MRFISIISALFIVSSASAAVKERPLSPNSVITDGEASLEHVSDDFSRLKITGEAAQKMYERLSREEKESMTVGKPTGIWFKQSSDNKMTCIHRVDPSKGYFREDQRNTYRCVVDFNSLTGEIRSL